MLGKRSEEIEKANGYHGRSLTTTPRDGRGGLIRAMPEHFGTDLATLRRARKAGWHKGLLAAMIRKDTTMKRDWISAQFDDGDSCGKPAALPAKQDISRKLRRWNCKCPSEGLSPTGILGCLLVSHQHR